MSARPSARARRRCARRGAAPCGAAPIRRRRSATARRSTAVPRPLPVAGVTQKPLRHELVVLEQRGRVVDHDDRPARRLCLAHGGPGVAGGRPAADGLVDDLGVLRHDRLALGGEQRGELRIVASTATMRRRCVGHTRPVVTRRPSARSEPAAGGRRDRPRRRWPAAWCARSTDTTRGSSGAGRGCRSASRTWPRRRAGRRRAPASGTGHRAWPSPPSSRSASARRCRRA